MWIVVVLSIISYLSLIYVMQSYMAMLVAKHTLQKYSQPQKLVNIYNSLHTVTQFGVRLGFSGPQASHDFGCEPPASSHVKRVNVCFRVWLGFLGPT